MTRVKRRRSGARGAALVEFAIVALVFLSAAFVVFEFSRIVLIYTTVTSSARIGARAAIVNGEESEKESGGSVDIPALVKSYAAAATLNPDNVTVGVTHPALNAGHPEGCNKTGCCVRVTVSYPYDRLFTFVPIEGLTFTASTQGVITY